MIIVDFDDTLFDTHRFKQTRKSALEPLGVSEDLFFTTYKEARNTPDGLFTYSDERHAEVLGFAGLDESAVFEALRGITHRSGDFLLPGALELLTYLKTRSEPLVLLSLGDPSAQELKVKHCGIDTFFDRLFMVEQSKVEIVTELLREHAEAETWFINDKVGETKEIHTLFPKLRAILKISPNIERGEYERSELPFFGTLSEIQRYIESYE